MKTAVDSPDYPPIAIVNGERVYANVTFGSNGETLSTLPAPIDFAPGRLHVHTQSGRIRVVFEFHRFSRHPMLLPFASWTAAALGRSLPLLSSHLKTEEHDRLLIAPPWPLDFMLRIEGIPQGTLERMVKIFLSHTAST